MVSTYGYSRTHLSQMLDRVFTAPATGVRPRALGFCDIGGSLRLASIISFIRGDDGSHFDGTGNGHGTRKAAVRFDTLDVAGDVQHVALGDVFLCHQDIRPDDGLPATPFAANILDQVIPGASPGSANVLG